jgi:Flp pilus assembly protein TadD
MRRPLWIAAAAAVLVAGPASAQVLLPIHARFGNQASIFIQPRVGPVWGFGYATTGAGFGYGPVFGLPPAWHGPAWNPYVSPPPIIIQNIIQQPPPVPIIVGPNPRGPVIPVEFEEPKPVMRAKAPARPVRPEVEKRALTRADADRLVEAGRTAFAAGQYGRALERFRKAAEITPEEPSAHYLVSQALFALGKYREAVAAIAAGVTLRPDWSEARFRSRDLYADRLAAFDAHLAELRKAVEMFPDDPALNFLLGHQLWFDGKPDEAQPFLLKARAAGNDRTPAAVFAVR